MNDMDISLWRTVASYHEEYGKWWWCSCFSSCDLLTLVLHCNSSINCDFVWVSMNIREMSKGLGKSWRKCKIFPHFCVPHFSDLNIIAVIWHDPFLLFHSTARVSDMRTKNTQQRSEFTMQQMKRGFLLMSWSVAYIRKEGYFNLKSLWKLLSIILNIC